MLNERMLLFLVVERADVLAWCETLAEAQKFLARYQHLARERNQPETDFAIFEAKEVR